MQIRFLSLFAATIAISATAVAFAQNVQTQNNPEPLVPIYMEYEGVKGETSSPPPPPPPPPQAPPAEHGVQAQPQAGLIVPAVQKMQTPPQERRDPLMDGVVLLNSEQGQSHGGAEAAHDVFVTEAAASDRQTYHVGSANGGVWKTTDGGSAAPSDVTPASAESDGLDYNFGGIEGSAAEEASRATETVSQQTAQAERPRRSFSISIGGVTVGSGGVSVAAGDINGDSRSSSTGSRRQATRPPR